MASSKTPASKSSIEALTLSFKRATNEHNKCLVGKVSIYSQLVSLQYNVNIRIKLETAAVIVMDNAIFPKRYIRAY